jgi:hypothetical protein
MIKAPNFYVQELLEPLVSDGLNEIDATRLDEAMRSFLQHLLQNDPTQRPRHYAVVVMTLEGEDEKGNDIVTTDVVSSMLKPDLHTLLRDWLHKETQ